MTLQLSSCRNFYRVAVDEVIKLFDFNDEVFNVIELVKPKNARSLIPKSLRVLFERFPEVRNRCDIAKADLEWREHANLPAALFGNSFDGNFQRLSVQFFQPLILPLILNPNFLTWNCAFQCYSAFLAAMLLLRELLFR